MAKIDSTLESFSHCMSKQATRIIDRAVAFLYFYAVKEKSAASLKQIINDFNITGLGNPNITILRNSLAKDRRIIKISKDEWRLKSDKIDKVEKEFQLNRCLRQKLTHQKIPGRTYINTKRFRDLKRVKSKFDLTRLLSMLSELNSAFEEGNYISVILLVRAILDHVPPIFGFNTFSEFANNYNGAKSFKDSILNLENSSRKIADAYLHIKIRSKETLPNDTQVNFSNDLDVLLAEIVRTS